MYRLTIQREFCAAHSIWIRGEQEPTHGHNWRVTIEVAGAHLDEDGLLCDFHELERELDDILAKYHNRDLNSTPPFDTVNPTAENVARHIGETLAPSLPDGVSLARSSVTEAPGCEATYLP